MKSNLDDRKGSEIKIIISGIFIKIRWSMNENSVMKGEDIQEVSGKSY
jgi:hypothetical protein